jgi:carbonic anhydrase
MKKPILPLLLCGLLVSTTSYAEGKAHWGYSGAEGPDHWASLSAEFGTCGSGKNQSPVNLTGMVEGDLPNMKVNYKVGGKEVLNNGHTIQVNYEPGSTISVAGKTFELKQFHFHSPSENTIEGHSYPMEAHFVHADKDGNLAVIAVMYKVGKQNAELEKAWAHMPHEAGTSHELHSKINAGVLLPHKHDYYRFNGSLTTPPCSEGVNWFVMKFYDTASQAQIDKFVHAMHHDNNRPVQPINARVVIK